MITLDGSAAKSLRVVGHPTRFERGQENGSQRQAAGDEQFHIQVLLAKETLVGRRFSR